MEAREDYFVLLWIFLFQAWEESLRLFSYFTFEESCWAVGLISRKVEKYIFVELNLEPESFVLDASHRTIVRNRF